MALTTEQLTAIKADIEASPDLNVHPNTLDGAWAIAALYNQAASPEWTVWKTDLPTASVKEALVWTEYIGRSDGERDTFALMISNGTIDPSNINVRQGIQDIFSGPNGVGTRAALVAIAKRAALRVEKLFSTGTGSDADPATMTREGTVSYQDVYTARNS